MLEVHALYAGYKSQDVLKGITMDVQPGEILAVIGPHGAGKSTLIRSISGVHPPRTGSVQAAGKDLTHLQPGLRARYLAVVPQAGQLPGAYTVYQTVLLGRTPHLNWLGQAGAADHAQTRWALEHTQTLQLAERLVGELSGGEQQRVLLARALSQDTPILLLDEPTTHLDLQHQTGLLNLVRRLALEKRLAVLLVLHDLNLASLYADRVALLKDGQIFAIGSPAGVLTSANLHEVYQVPVHVIPHPDYGTPLILPDGRSTPVFFH